MDFTMDNTRTALHSLEIAARYVDKSLINDSSAPTLLDIMNISAQSGATSSGASDNDYPNLTRLPVALHNIAQIKTTSKVPLPPEILERFNHIQCHSMMGLFTEINRAWLTIDSDIYIWTYEEGGDVAYYDGLSETILCVGLVFPKPGVFHSFINYLLVLTTATDIVVLGVTFTPSSNNALEEIQLVPDPVFTLPTDGSTITTIVGTASGRLFLGSKEGCLFEISYQAESSWFGKRCKKLNHSTNTLSFLMPSFLNAALSEDDSIAHITIDNSRHILYALTEKGSIWVYDLGETGTSLSKVTKLSQASLVQQAMNTVKTLDSQNFRPIVSISAVEARESGHINLVAVSQTGVRFYLSVTGFSNLQANQRPYTLTLIHVRLPPGYSAVMTTRPRMVHMASYRDSNLMLISSVNDKDTLWCINPDMFPFSPMFMEAYTTVTLDGPAWAMAEVCHQSNILQQQSFLQAPPLAVRQHFEPPRKFVVLTAQGAHIFLKFRPVDLLRQLLVDCHGPDNEAIKTFFMIQKEDQACATSLILACLENVQNADVAEWATRAFFVYGGEPKIAPPPSFNQSNPFAGSTPFLPNVMSTPISPHLQMRQQQLQSQPQSPSPLSLEQSQNSSFTSYSPFIYSPKHNGLYLYLGRILRPLWNMYCVEKLQGPANKIYLKSTLSGDDCTWILSHLNALRSFLERNTRLTVNNTIANQTAVPTSFGLAQQTLNTSRLNQTLQDAQLEERQSLDAFKNFVNHCCQILGLWRILCEHQFHILVDLLPVSHQQMLQNTAFKDLILFGQEICVSFINGLISSYLADDALIDSISSKLRDICPDLYKTEDAACSKSYEMLKMARTLQSSSQQEDLIMTALQLCKSVAPNINLHEICQQLASLSAYHAITDLCVTCAKKVDPDNIAEFYYKNGSDAGQQDSYNFYAKRMKVYKEILLVLDNLHAQITSSQNVAGTSTEMQTLSVYQEKIEMIRRVIADVLKYQDELLHVAIYEWMMAKQMDGDVIKITQPSLEKFLIKASQQTQENVAALELLWKYYESNNNHASAANILYKLANKSGNMLTLKDRLGHLARGVMCMRSDKVGYAPHLGVFLRDLEDKLEMGKVQEQVLDAIINLQGGHLNSEQAINALNSGLYDLTQLYEEFSDPFNLWESKLAIIDCAGYSDNALIENIWQNIIENEFRASTGTGDDKLAQILTKVTSLIRRYRNSANSVPLYFIVQKLESISVTLRASPNLVPNMISAEIPMETAVQIYNDLVCASSTDRFWSLEENEFHLAEAFAELVNKFLCHESIYDHHLRTKIKAPCEDAVAKLLSSLYSKPNTDHLINILRSIQSRLARC